VTVLSGIRAVAVILSEAKNLAVRLALGDLRAKDHGETLRFARV